jgi:hypothetical protein
MRHLCCNCQIFGRYESQRTWVIQEILTSLVKLPDTKKTQKQFKFVPLFHLPSA